ncbi:MAG: class I SAM-dependent rRNA methyltransferase [Candidatus Spyradenecus sp.]
MKIVRLKAKRDYPTRMGHPWIFSGAVDSVSREPALGETVLVTDAVGEALGMGAWSPASQIRVRMWHTQAQTPADEAFFRDRLACALALRAGMAERFATDALRLVNAEADGLPGVTVDRYGQTLVGQFTTAGAEVQKPLLVRLLMELTGAAGFYERSDGESRKHEGLEPATGLLAGTEPPERIALHEAGVVYEVDVRSGHKTGFYLDQRENRRLIAAYAASRTVLNAFSYTGGFGVAAQVAGAQAVTHIDLSAPALAQARRNAALNPGADSCRLDFVQGNVFQELRALRDRARSFGLVVLDPPKFAETRSQTAKALRGYKDINLLGLKLVEKGGLLATFSCSGAIDPPLFRRVVAEAAHDAGRSVRILHELRQAPDHVEALTFPEGLYLKGLLCEVQ